MRDTSLIERAQAQLTALGDAFFRFFVTEFLARAITKGQLVLHSGDESLMFGQTEAKAKANSYPVVHLRLNNASSFFFRVASAADIGLAEAYMERDIDGTGDEMLQLFELLILNRDQGALNDAQLAVSKLGTTLNRCAHLLRSNTISGSQRNIAAHYDLSNDMFACFLGRSWTYSCAVFGENDDLDAAQWRKLDLLIDKARITADCHVLEIGCGWGELAIRAARKTGCRVTGITLSEQQLRLGRERVKAAGLDGQVELLMLDYRRVGSLGVKFDRIVSIEMIEAVGHEFLEEYFRCVERALSEDGLVVLQVITTPEERYEQYRSSVDFIQKYIFPGGVCPSFEALVCAWSRSRLVVESVQNIGVHYATTLREWRRRMEESARTGMVEGAGFDDRFIRMWRYYLVYCEAGFGTRTLGTLQIALSRTCSSRSLPAAPRCRAQRDGDEQTGATRGGAAF